VMKDARHDIANTVLGLFYSKLLRAQSTPREAHAASEFLAACKACLAFFVLYIGSSGKQPDAIYRSVFQDPTNLSITSGSSNQTTDILKSIFRNALEAEKIFDSSNQTNAQNLWVAGARNNLNFSRLTLSRFALFVAAHDRHPDTTPGNEGLTKPGRLGSSPYLKCLHWFSKDYSDREHVANKTEPKAPYEYPLYFDSGLYPRDADIVNKLGNLALWGSTPNKSAYDEWPDKVYYYSTLTSLGPTTPVDLAKLKGSLGIRREPPGLPSTAASSEYIANLAPIAFRGQAGLTWDAQFVLKRTDHLCEVVFDYLWDWIS